MRFLSVSSMRNEGPFLLEWLAHHLGAGFTDFLIYSNDCDDGTAALLDALDAAGIITHVPQIVAEGESPQWQALRAAWRHPLRRACDWAMVSDADEFINIHVGHGQLGELFAALPQDIDAIALPWRLFGNNGHMRFTDQPTTRLFTASAPVDCPYPVAATLFKSLFRLKGPFNQFGVHRPRQKTRAEAAQPIWVDGAGRPLPPAFTGNMQRLSLAGLPSGRALAECNHYSLRSAESFMVKRRRGLPNRSDKAIDLAYWVERNFNTIENRSIARMEPATRLQWARLFAIPGIRDLHSGAVAQHQARFLAQMLLREEQRLFGQIAVTGSSQIASAATIQDIFDWYREIIAREARAERALPTGPGGLRHHAPK